MKSFAAFLMASLATTIVWSSSANADDCSAIRRDNVARCAVAASLAVRVDLESTNAARGKRAIHTPWFPSNPTLSFSAARRSPTEGRSDALNVYGVLSQEIELSGQRASRRRSAENEIAARTDDEITTKRRVAAAAYEAMFEVIAAREALRVAERVEQTGEQIATVTRARAEAGAASALDAEIAEALGLRSKQSRLAAERALGLSNAMLALVLNRDPRQSAVLDETTSLAPLAGSDALLEEERIRPDRPEIRALLSEGRAFTENAEAYRRARIPNLTLQIFGQNDGYNERVFGGGLSLPLPLPEPMSRLYSGQIAESEAMARARANQAELRTRELGFDLTIAREEYRSRKAEAALFDPSRVTRTEQMMTELGKEIQAGRLAVRDAVVAQQQLIDIVRGAVETRRALCRASVELAVAAGVALEDGGAR